MTSETARETLPVKTEAAQKEGWMYPLSDPYITRADVRKVWKECKEESFWYRALPLSLGSMAVTGGLIYRGIWKSSKHFGPFPKLAVAGILGFAVGKASYVGTCLNKFHDVGIDVKPGFGPWSGRRCPAPGESNCSNKEGNVLYYLFVCPCTNRSCQHVCEECKKKVQAAPAEQIKS